MISGALDEWTATEWGHGIQLNELCELDSLSLRTHNSTYRIIVTVPSSGEVLVRGGERFPVFTRARLSGSTTGGNLVKHNGIYPGLRLEFERGGRRIVTSVIMSVNVDPPGPEQ